VHVSSSLVRTSLKFGKDIFDYVPEKIKEDVIKLQRKRNV